MATPDDRRYSESHEWHQADGDVVTVGVTQFAVNELTDVTYVEIHEPGTSLDAGGSIGEVESVKATSEIYSAVGGEIVERNEALGDDPGLLNRDPYGEGWLCRIRVTDPSPLEGLMDAATYEEKYPV
ncbi:MAG: glycine cleavage system protein GcvH [Phycisphaerales bacterium]